MANTKQNKAAKPTRRPKAKAAPARKAPSSAKKAAKKPAQKTAAKKPAAKKGPAVGKIRKKIQKSGKDARKTGVKSVVKAVAGKTAKKTAANKTAKKVAPKAARKIAPKAKAPAPAAKPSAKQMPKPQSKPQPKPAPKAAARPSAPAPKAAAPLSAFLKKQQARLLALRDGMLDSMAGVAKDNLRSRAEGSEASAFGMHQADAGSDAYDRDFALSLLSQEQDALYEIEEALKRIDTGAYGICEVSGKAIPHPRLEAIPFARCTVECQAQIEKQRRAIRIRQPVTSLFGLTEEEAGAMESEEEETPADAKE